MEKYQEIIEQQLSQLMPACIASINENEEYVKTAPEVKGYFKFITIRYMKRVKDIKKMCIEYINTYIDGCLNLAKKMDDVKLIEAQDSLAKDINFSKEGASTDGSSKKATTKAGVLFLTGDKALKDKLNAILEKIKKRANKSEILIEWADLMVIQSKITANDIVFEETNKMIKDETSRKKQEEKKEKESADWKKKFEESEKERQKIQKSLNDLLTKYGERSQWFKDKDVSVEDLKKSTEGITAEDFEKPVTSEGDSDNEKSKSDTLNDEGNVNKNRKDFYKDFGFEKASKEVLKQMVEKVNELGEDISDEIWHYLYSCCAVDKSKADGSFVASTIDVCIALRNTKSALDLFEKSDKKNSVIEMDLDAFEIEDMDETIKKKAFDFFITNKDFDTHCVYLFTRMFEDKKTNEKLHIKIPAEFIYEQMFDTSMKMRDMEMAMMDVLDECEGGCLYIGNFPGIKDVDYIMLDGDGSFGIYEELGNLDRALTTGEPQNVNLIEMTDGQRAAIISTVLEKLSEEVI